MGLPGRYNLAAAAKILIILEVVKITVDKKLSSTIGIDL